MIKIWPGRRIARPKTLVPTKKAAENFDETVETFSTGRDNLSTELWILIIREIDQISNNVSNYRLISRRFNAIVSPFVFNISRVTGAFFGVVDFARTLPDGVPLLVKTHATRLVFGEEDLDWKDAAQFIKECVRVRDIEWNHGHTDLVKSFPPAIREVFDVDRPHLLLHMKGFYNQKPGDAKTGMHPDFTYVPWSKVVSFSTDCGYWSHHLATLQEMLVASKNLSTLDIMAGGKYYPRDPSTITQFSKDAGLLPPIKTLVVGGVWTYTKEEIPKIWDFSQLESLHIRPRCIRGFLDSVPGDLIAGVRKLRVDDVIGAIVATRGIIPELLGVMADFLGEIKGLVDVQFLCPSPKDLIPILSHHASTLQVLKLEDTSARHPTISYDDLVALQACLPNLRHLQLDLYFPPLESDLSSGGASRQMDDKNGWYIREFRLGVIASCPNLRTLHIRLQSTFQEYGTTYRKPFCDKVVKELTLKKEGKPFAEIKFHWRRRQSRVPAVRHHSITMFYNWDASKKMTYQLLMGPKVLGT